MRQAEETSTFVPLLNGAEKPVFVKLREELYREYIHIASEGETDNEPVIGKILSLKQEKAELLGFPNHAEVSMASKVSIIVCIDGKLTISSGE